MVNLFAHAVQYALCPFRRPRFNDLLGNRRHDHSQGVRRRHVSMVKRSCAPKWPEQSMGVADHMSAAKNRSVAFPTSKKCPQVYILRRRTRFRR